MDIDQLAKDMVRQVLRERFWEEFAKVQQMAAIKRTCKARCRKSTGLPGDSHTGDMAAKKTEATTLITAVMIDGCQHTFHHLASEVLPSYLAILCQSTPYPMSIFATPGQGSVAIFRQVGKTEEFPGCYVLWEGDVPFYTGIGRKVVSRLMRHVRGKTHFDASLAYRMACNGKKHDLRRTQAMANQAFNAQFEAAKEQIADMTVRFVEIANPLERYLFEVYASMELGTYHFSTFDIH